MPPAVRASGRNGFDETAISQLHADAVCIMFGATVALIWGLVLVHLAGAAVLTALITVHFDQSLPRG